MGIQFPAYVSPQKVWLLTKVELSQLVSNVDVAMNLECCQSCLPYSFQLNKSHVHPHFDTVNDLQLQLLQATLSEVNPQLTCLVINLIPVATMSCMHVIDTFSNILLLAPFACNVINAVFGFAS